MIKRLYLFNGNLLAPLSNTAEDISVDADTASALLNSLTYGDYCYLTLNYNDQYEVIRITHDYTGLRVDRGLDGTQKYNFPIETSFTYKLTSIEIQDAVNNQGWNIYADGYGVATVDGDGKGNYTIGYPDITPSCVGGIDSFMDGANIDIVDATGAFGCCGDNGTGAPGIPGAYFYLTSMLYPQEVSEVITGQPKDKNGNDIQPINFNGPGFWLLVQPDIIELKGIATSVNMPDWELYGGAASFTASPEKYISTSSSVGDMNLFGGAVVFTAPNMGYILTDSYPLQMQLFGGAVVYNNALEKYINPTVVCRDMSLI